jgi:DNA-binding response OmpR family regulator
MSLIISGKRLHENYIFERESDIIMARILVIDDDLDFLALMKTFLMDARHDVLLLMRADKALEEISRFQPDLVLLDIMMPGISGAQCYQAIRKECGAALPIMIITGSDMILKGVDDPILKYLRKPVDLVTLNRTINKLLPEEKPGENK